MHYRTSLGPFHPGWPGVLRLDLEIEEGIVQTARVEIPGSEPVRAEDWAGLSLAEGGTGVARLCASSSWSYTMAYCQALEKMAHLEIPPRARFLRLIVAEVERIASHLLAAGKILHLARLTPLAVTLWNLWEHCLRDQQRLTGTRLFPALNIPGGLCRDLVPLETITELIRRTKASLYRISHQVISDRSVIGHLIGTGLLTKEKAEEEGLGGPVLRASGSDRDLRRDQPYAAYGDLDPQVVTQSGGDVFARWMVLILEVFESLRLLETALANLPDGTVYSGGIGDAFGEAQSRVEAPTGPLVVRVQVDEFGRLAGLWRTPPSPVHLSVLPQTLPGQRFDLIGVIVASWGLCPACLVR